MSEKRYEHRKQIKSVRWLIFWVVLAQLAVDIAIQAVISFMETPPHGYLVIAVSELVALGIPIAVYGKSMWQGSVKRLRSELMLNRCPMAMLIISAGIGAGGQFVMMLLNIPANFLMLEVMGKEISDAVPVALSMSDVMLGLVAVVLIPSVLEEFCLRGLVFGAYNKCNTVVAIVYTTMVFALLHMRLNELCGFVFMGLVSVLVLLKTKSLFAVMVYHGVSNLTALIFGFVLSGILSYLWIIFAVAIALFVICLILLLAFGQPIKLSKVFKGQFLFCQSIFSLPTLLSIGVVILRFFIVSD